MAITPSCDICAKELKDFGAIVLGPPDQKGMVDKFHVCKPCYDGQILDLLHAK